MVQTIDAFKSEIAASGGVSRPNLFVVQLPTIGNVSMQHMNMLCRSTNMPGKQILTYDRRIGMQTEKVAYGYAVPDVNLSFLLLNDYKAKRYFDSWRSLTINENSQIINYKSNYARSVRIFQLADVKNDFLLGEGVEIDQVNRLAVNASDLSARIVYGVELIDAFPTTVGGVDLNDAIDTISELGVQLSFTNWREI